MIETDKNDLKIDPQHSKKQVIYILTALFLQSFITFLSNFHKLFAVFSFEVHSVKVPLILYTN